MGKNINDRVGLFKDKMIEGISLELNVTIVGLLKVY